MEVVWVYLDWLKGEFQIPKSSTVFCIINAFSASSGSVDKGFAFSERV
jgi:hypothetical protein